MSFSLEFRLLKHLPVTKKSELKQTFIRPSCNILVSNVQFKSTKSSSIKVFTDVVLQNISQIFSSVLIYFYRKEHVQLKPRCLKETTRCWQNVNAITIYPLLENKYAKLFYNICAYIYMHTYTL